MGKLLLLFTIVPLVELYLLMQLAQVMGLGSTILLVLLTGGLGAALAKREGLRVIRSWQASLSAGRVPDEGVVGGLLVLVGGVLLITPGVLTDLFGLLLLVPATRRALAALIMARVQRGIAQGTIHVVDAQDFQTGRPFSSRRGPYGQPGGHGPGGYAPGPRRAIDREVIEVEAKVVDVDP